MSDSEKRQLPAEVLSWNQTEKNYPLDKPVTWFFEEQVRATPQLEAVRFEDERLSYEELNRRVNRVARFLTERGIHEDDFVGVYMERSIEMVIALLGIVKAGAAYVPFDPEYPADRLSYMFSDSSVRFVLTQRKLKDRGLPAGIEPVFLDADEFKHAVAGDETNPEPLAKAHSAVYMIYTSGSTGKPKGVPNVHCGLVNRVLWMQDAYRLGPGDRVLQKTPYSFDVSVWEFFWPLITGASIVVAKPGGHRDNEYLVNAIVAHAVTTMHFVPSMLGLFLTGQGLERITTLRQVMSSGEALPFELTRRFFTLLPNTKLHNLYGPTEASIDVTYWECRPDYAQNIVPIGYPIANTYLYILDEQLNPVPIGEAGELHIGGVGLARGYWNRPELTQERFIQDPFASEPGARLYKTGDLARYLPDGAIEYLGRLDFQVKLRGFRIELGEIEAVLLKQPGVREAVVTATESGLEEKQLVAYVVSTEDRPSVAALKQGLLKELPEYMVPSRFMYLDVMPLSPNGKVDRKALPKVVNQRADLVEMFVAPQTQLQRDLARVWKEVLDLDRVGIKDNFFDLGGNSLQLLKLVAALKTQLDLDVPAVKVFQFPSVEKLAGHIAGTAVDPLLDDAFQRVVRSRGQLNDRHLSGAVAIIGMVGRFPGASNLQQLWSNLINDVESIRRFTPEELAEGVDEETRNDPNYVPCRGIVDDADKFDASFFGIGPQEAKVMDPQQRVFLELAWAALEEAGYDPSRFSGMVGVYAGVGDNHYYYNNVLCHPEMVKMVGKLIAGYGNEKDYIATRVSYQLDLTGPSVSATTGCSTSLLSVDNAVKALNAFECDMALAGGVDVMSPQKSGQIHQAGGPFTKDGHCRPFDADASGTMFCDGAGIVVLRRLEDAVAAGDHIYAVVLGSAKNNDGAQKVSFLAPSVEGQARVIALAQAQANVQADSISYVEAHGTGTPLGDPIEVEALTKAFRATTDKTHFCKIGSIKGHIGHPTIASGIAGFIKVALALYYEEIPGTLHYQKPNPRLELNNSPFEILAARTPWPRRSTPRRGAVSSFGFGGTNVHAILEEAPPPPPSSAGRPQQLLLLTGKTSAALERQRKQLAVHLASHPELTLADVAYTLQVGRKHFAYRDFVVAPSAEQAIPQLVSPKAAPPELNTIDPGVVFLFPGQGAQHANMARDLYLGEPEFRRWIDLCCDLFRPHLDRDLREVLFPPAGNEAPASELLMDTAYTQPAMFAIETSLARWWMSLGVKPVAVIGHSIGEFAGAYLSGVFELADVIRLVALRARLISGLARGTMLSVQCPAKDLEGQLPPDVQLAAVNGPTLCVVAGPHQAVTDYAQQLLARGIVAKPLHTSHAFHSAMMEPIVGEFEAAVARAKIGVPTIPFLSTSLADWLTQAEQLGASYWSQHIRRPVLFANAVGRALADLDPSTVFLEIGPREVLCTLTRMQASGPRKARIVCSLSEHGEPNKDLAAVTASMGRLWASGVSIDWNAYRGEQQRRRIPLPTYAFEKKHYWLSPRQLQPVAGAGDEAGEQAVPLAGADAAEPIVTRAARTDGQAVGKPVQGLRLGRDTQRRPAWFVPDLGQSNGIAPLVGAPAAGHDPFCLPERKVLSATLAQRRFWEMAQTNPDAALAFHEAFSIRFEGPLEDAALLAAVQGLAVIHEAVRGHFEANGHEFVIEPAVDVPVTNRDLGQVSEAEFDSAVANAETAEAERRYDLATGPLARVTILKAGDTKRAVLLAAHSAICDGWSLDVLLEDLGRLYASFAARSAPSQLPTHGWSDYVARQASAVAVARAQQARAFFTQRLTPPPSPVVMPYDKPRPSKRTFGAQFAAHTLAESEPAAVKSFARSQGVSFFSVMFAGLVAQLQRRSGANDLLVGVSFAGHPEAGMQDAVGRLVSVVPVRVRLNGDEKFPELCRRCHAAVLDAAGNASVSIEDLADELNLTRDPSKAPLTALFTYVREYHPGELNFGDAAVTYHAVARRATLAEIDLTVVEGHDRLVFAALGNSDLSSQSWLEGFVNELVELLASSCMVQDGAGAALGAGVAAPKDAIERYLVGTWKEILGVAEVGVETSFYELGGHSLLALQVFNGLHEKYKVRLPLSALVEHNTIRALASHVRTLPDFHEEATEPTAAATAQVQPGQMSGWNTVVALQKKGELPPFFCVAGLGGNPMNLRHLADALGTNQPFYGLQHRGVDGVLHPHDTIEAMAAEFIADIRRVQPNGPYYLGGFSFGGLAAYEVAQQLLAAGDRVGGLVMLDTSNPNVLTWPLKDRVWNHLVNMRTEGPMYLKNRTLAKLRTWRDQRDWHKRVAAAKTDSFTYRVELVTEMSNQAERRYAPAPLDAEVVLIKSEFRVPPVEGIGYPPHESNGWRSLVAPGKLDIRLVSSSHLDMVVVPHATETARRIADGLAALRAKGRAV